MDSDFSIKKEQESTDLHSSSTNNFFLNEGVSPMWKITLKERIQFLLASRGLTQNKLAEEIGINHGTLSKIINGNWSPTAKIKLLLSKFLEVDSLVLFGDKEYFLDYQKSIKKMERGENANN